MQSETIYCNADAIRFIKKEDLPDGNFTISLYDILRSGCYELMIFIGRQDNEYWLKIHKKNPEKIFSPRQDDNFKRYEETEEYVIFFFDDFEVAREFFDSFYARHYYFISAPSRLLENIKFI